MGTFIAGLPYIRGIKKIAEALSEGDELKLVREPKNQFDDRAILIRNANNKKMGYVPRRDNEVISRLMDGGMCFKAVVDRIDFRAEEDMNASYALSIHIGIYMIV